MTVRTLLRLSIAASAAVAIAAPLAVNAQPPAAPPGAPAAAPGGAPGGAAPAAEPTPSVAGSIAGVYRGKVTAGPNTGTDALVWVIKYKDETVRVMSNRLAVANGDVNVKDDGGKVVQANGEIQLSFDKGADPVAMEYRLGPTVFTGVREQILGDDL